MVKWKILILMMLCAPLVMGAICEDRLDNGSSCTMLTPSLICSNYTYDIVRDTGTIMLNNANLTLLNNSIYYLNFTQESGNYIVELCSGQTREIVVNETYDAKFQQEVSSRMAIAIAILLFGATVIMFYLAINSKQKAMQIGYTLFGFLFVVADLFFAARITEVINPSYTGIISNLDTMYAVVLYSFVFLIFLAVLTLFIWVIRSLINTFSKKRRMEKDEEEWMQYGR